MEKRQAIPTLFCLSSQPIESVWKLNKMVVVIVTNFWSDLLYGAV